MAAPVAGDARVRNRLHRIEGQVRGIQRMIDDDRPLTDILVQIAAVRSALAGAGRELVRAQARDCSSIDRQDLDDVMRSIDALIGHA